MKLMNSFSLTNNLKYGILKMTDGQNRGDYSVFGVKITDNQFWRGLIW